MWRAGAVGQQRQRFARTEQANADGSVGVDGAQFKAAEGAEKEAIRRRVDGV